MQLLGEPPEGALDRRRGGILLHPQDFVGVAHPGNSKKLMRPHESAASPAFVDLYVGPIVRDCNELPAQDRDHGRKLLTSQAPCLARQASPCIQVSRTCGRR